ncbi:Calx-beta domain-containing protein, partial [Lyngbya sp. CCY1209]|uniref:Calx-beta domain-containing protein n=1 Tax=Lyngbya sp. CCY1209 TaxID=2886103 RepID=UPI002D20442B
VGEADGTAQFTVTLDDYSSETVSVSYTTVGGTASSGSDYSSTSGELVFSPWEIQKTIDVSLWDDTQVEGDETFEVVLSDPENGELGSER